MTGLELAQRFWAEAVRPVIDELLPGRPRAAALFGNGSEVLGFDDERSTDHGFGPRVMVLIDGVDTAGITDELDQRLPETFAGFPVRFPRSDGARPSSIPPLTMRRVRWAATCTGRVRTLTASGDSCLLGMSSAYRTS